MARYDEDQEAVDTLGMDVYGVAESGAVNPTSPRLDELPEPEEETEEQTDIQGLIQQALEEAQNHFEEDLEPDMVKATDYYHGRKFGNEKKGRSQVVSPVLRDVTLTQLPSLVRIFFGPERVVEFRPRTLDEEDQAAQQTDYVRYIVTEENNGFLQMLAVMKDALVRRLGIVKWWWDEKYRVEVTEYTGLTESQLLVLQDEQDVEDMEVLAAYPAGEPVLGPGGYIQPPTVYDVTVTHRRGEGCAKFAAVPPEEFRFTPFSRDLESAPLVAHVREVPVEDLVALGLDEELVREHQGRQERARSSEDLAYARHITAQGGTAFGDEPDEDGLDESQRPVVFAEAYALVDVDGDGVSELRLFRCLGPEFEIVNGDGLGEIVDEVPFAVFTPDPEPHTLVGLSNYDLVGDLQMIDSQLWRGMLDSLSEAIIPTTEVVQGEVNMGDVLKPEASKIVRVRRPGMIREVSHSFAGGDVLPVLAQTAEMRENRTGTSKAAMGLDADALQSATKAAVAATLSGSQQRLELLAMVFAHTGFRRLFKGLQRLVIKHQSWARVVKMRGKYVEVDPRYWEADLDVQVNIGLGQGTPDERRIAHEKILEFQATAMQNGVPFVSFVELRNGIEKYAQLLGYSTADAFFKPWGPEQQQQYEQMQAEQPPQPDPNMALVEVEKAKAESRALVDAEKLDLEKWKARMEDDRERDRIAREIALKEREIEAKHKVDIKDAELRAQVDLDRARMDADVKRETAPVGGEA